MPPRVPLRVSRHNLSLGAPCLMVTSLPPAPKKDISKGSSD